MQRLLSGIVQKGEDNGRYKRGLFNFVGRISKTLFGTMDDDDAQYYHDQIERFEQGSTTLTQLVKQQLIVVKSTLRVFNETLSDVEYNENEGWVKPAADVCNDLRFTDRKRYLLIVSKNHDRGSYSQGLRRFTSHPTCA